MSIPTRDLTKQWRDGDAQRMARFWNVTFEGWPWGGSDPITAEEAERRTRERQQVGCFVAEADGKIVSLCDLQAKPTDTTGSYVGLLTADPAYHGRGFGKAVLLSAVERAYERGIDRVDLHTWPGNLKAVPLYKKSGFMWSPDSEWGVYMQNFTPAARRQPIAREFFRKHDWYRTIQRDLSLAPDENKRGKVRVYEYLWEEDGERLRMVYDRNSWGLVEMETDDFAAGCFLEEEKLVAGLPQQIKWRIVNHGREPLDVVLVASADEGVSLDHKEVLQVRGRAEVEAGFEVDPDMREKEKDPRAAIVRTDLLVNGEPITLQAGFQVKQPVHFSLHGDGLRPNRPEPVVIQCRNELDKPARVKVRVTPSPGVELDRSTASVRLPAKGSAELPITLNAKKSGTAALKVEAEATAGRRTVRPKKADLYASVLEAGEIVGRIEKDHAVLESAALRVSIRRQNGWMAVNDKLRQRHEVAALWAPQLGPPFSWDEFFETRCEARIEQESGRAVAVLTTPSIYRPGVVLEQRIALSNLPLIEIRSSVMNGSTARLDVELRRGAEFRTHRGQTAVPGDGGVVRARRGGAGRSLSEHRPADEGKKWAEGWIAAEDSDGIAAGLLWGAAQRVDCGDWGSHITQRLPAAMPGQSVEAEPVYAFVGDGDHFTVRRWWQLLHGPRQDREQRHEPTRQPFEFGLRPRPAIIHGRSAEVELAAESFGRLELSGGLSAEAPEGLRVRPRRAEFKRAGHGRKRATKVQLSRAASTPEGGYFVDCTARIDRAVYRERQPVIVLGDPRREVTVEQTGEEGELFRLENGVLSLAVAPAFKGSAVSLQRNGEELLRSAYPDARPLGTANPWMGGIEPHFGGLDSGQLAKERFTAREIERRGRRGIVWRGVRVSCSPKHERRREDRLALDYLLAPGSRIFALAIRTTHRGGAATWLEGNFSVWPVLGGSYLDAVMSGSIDPRTSRLRCRHGGDIEGDRWAIAENPKAGEAVLMACSGVEAGVSADIVGRDGYCLLANAWGRHESKQTRESVFFISYLPAGCARDLAEALSELKELP
jgi:ribosomal protein S18 acetylase RimI-like enzyme